MKLCIAVTARASFARIVSVLRACQASPMLDLTVALHTSAMLPQYGDIRPELTEMGINFRCLYNALIPGPTSAMAKTSGLAMVELATLFEELKPEAVMTIADRYETLATAATAAYMNIPLIHLQGGERSGSIDDRVRDAVSMFAELHFPATAKAAENLIRMDVRGNVWPVGCPSIDVIAALDDKPVKWGQYTGIGPPVDPGCPYILVAQHPVTTEAHKAYAQMRETICAVTRAIREMQVQAIWIHPNLDAGTDGASKALREFHEYAPALPIHFYRNIAPEDFGRAMKHCMVLVGNSSAGIRESAYLGTPVVNVGTRQRHRERAENVVDADHNELEIYRRIREQSETVRYPRSRLYGDGHAADRILEALW